LSGLAAGQIFSFLLYGLTPPAALAWLAFRGDDMQLGYFASRWEDPWQAFVCLVLGLICWAIGAWLLWAFAQVRFRRMSNRTIIPRRGDLYRKRTVALSPGRQIEAVQD
jgi:hypothetical protein